ncbi:low molecular weight protein-tyrosine-phosphatase [Paraburkholderia tropica]|uniref:low molecular weight protein-tyrosine-phosphatase n=1 Tax=Paraburkholderia tropica TaxID=92647 RepID=UPI0015923497|nr:low molecular weight protein-tyrosine-phosphatase [Paraburkholderia tropica]
MISSILVVCIGNVCRSPMAEGVLRERIPSVELSSAGIGALVDKPAQDHAIALMSERGIDITTHRARQIVTPMCRDTDLILVMDNEQKRVIEDNYVFTCGRVFRIGHFGNFDVPDPYGGPRRQFAESLDLIDSGVEAWAERIRGL